MVIEDWGFFGPLLAAGVALLFAAVAEALHARRVARVAALAFGPTRRPAAWARTAPYVRALSFGALAWGLATLFYVEPRRYEPGSGKERTVEDPRHILLVLDVSPSMRLEDAGPDRKQSRMARARTLMESFFDRVPLDEFRVSVVAVYNGAKPVVVDTNDFEVVRNILGDLPMHHAFRSGQTKLFDGLEEAAKMAKPWKDGSATVVLLSDGDTVPATGMPRMPPSVRSVIVVGVGDSTVGKFIDGRQSRQDVPTLRQIAARLGGSFHNGNDRQIDSAVIAESIGVDDENLFERLGLREYALLAAALAALVLGLLPAALAAFGSGYRPGRKPRPAEESPLVDAPAGAVPRGAASKQPV